MDEYYNNYYIHNCDRNVSYLASAQFLETSCHIGSFLNLLFSSYALFLMLKKSPKAMRSSVPFMIHLHVWTILCDFMFAVMLLPLFMLPLLAGNVLGLFWYLNVPIKLQLWLAFAALGGMVCSILTVFEQRHRSIVTNSKFVMRRKSTRIVYNVFMYGYHINFGMPEVLTTPDVENQEYEKIQLFKILPCPPPSFFIENTFVMQRDGSLFNPHMYFTCFSLSCVAAFYSFHTFWFLLPANNPTMSPATRKLQRNFFFAMCIQICIPVFIILLPNIYWNVSITFKFHIQELNNFSIFFFTLHGISASFAITFLYAPYRKYTIELVKTKIFRIKTVKPSAAVSSVTVSAQRSTTRVE